MCNDHRAAMQFNDPCCIALQLYILSVFMRIKVKKSQYFESGTKRCKARFRSSNGHISSHFNNIHVKLQTHVYSMVLFHSMRSRGKHSNNIVYDVITNELSEVSYQFHLHTRFRRKMLTGS